jgi:hypothetical protein
LLLYDAAWVVPCQVPCTTAGLAALKVSNQAKTLQHIKRDVVKAPLEGSYIKNGCAAAAMRLCMQNMEHEIVVLRQKLETDSRLQRQNLAGARREQESLKKQIVQAQVSEHMQHVIRWSIRWGQPSSLGTSCMCMCIHE